jgi:hypothetical protein
MAATGTIERIPAPFGYESTAAEAVEGLDLSGKRRSSPKVRGISRSS